jgi:hypothetical protein
LHSLPVVASCSRIPCLNLICLWGLWLLVERSALDYPRSLTLKILLNLQDQLHFLFVYNMITLNYTQNLLSKDLLMSLAKLWKYSNPWALYWNPN